MKREEALEYMNRYLDHDLNEEETETLFRHLGESPDARADFEFLQGLSDKLESLPDVTPPISLVDSILPRLDEIDRVTPLKREEPDQPVVMTPSPQTTQRRKASVFWRSTLGRAVGGTAVAAAVLGIFVATYKPQEMPNAEVTSTSAVSNATDDTLVSGGATEQGTAPDVTDPSTEVQDIEPEAQKMPKDEAAQRKVNPPTQESQPAETKDQQQDRVSTPDSSGSAAVESSPDTSSDSKSGGGGTQQGTEGSKDTGNKDSAAKSSQDKNESPKKTPSSESKPNTAPNPTPNENKNTSPKLQSPTPPNADKPAATEKAQPKESIRSFGAEEDEETGNVEPNGKDSGTAESDTLDEPKEDNRTYSLMMAPTEWVSPNNTYVVTYSPGLLTLLKGDRSEELGTLKIDGEATNGIWSADGNTFTYDLLKPDGTTTPQTWKIEETTLKQGK